MDYWQNDDRTWSKDSLYYIETPSKLSQELLFYIQESGRFKASKPYFTEREHLPSFLMKYTTSGQGTLFYEGQTYILEKGDFFWIDCSKYQHYYTSSEEPWEMDWVHFYGSNAASFYEHFMRTGTNVCHAPQSRIPRVMQMIFDLQKQKNAKTDLRVSLLIHELLNEMLLNKFEIDFEDDDIPDYLTEIKHYLDLHFRETITLDQLAAITNRDKFQLSKEFSRYMGVSPIDHHLLNKVTHAKELLRYSSKSIKEIANEVGITNASYFTRLFKSRTGMTPMDYRRIR